VAANWATFGLFQDPDGLGVQLVADPGGWFPTVIDAAPLVDAPALLTPMGLGHVSLQVSDMAQSLDFYRRYFGIEGGSNDSGQIWFAMGATNLVLTPAAEAAIDHIGVKVAAFDMDATAAALEDMGAQRVEAVDGQFGPILRFADPAGLVLELEPQQA
jgi:catechol 2,3-dioxygenase-like lactoylglutathione lyase family enzyme